MNHLGGLQWPDPGRKLQGLGPDGWTGLLLCEEYMLLARNFGCLEVAITRVTPAARIRNKTMVYFDTRKRGLLKILIMVLISFQFTRIWKILREQCPRSRAVREAHLVGTERTQRQHTICSDYFSLFEIKSRYHLFRPHCIHKVVFIVIDS
jgi:hypothetical protein